MEAYANDPFCCAAMPTARSISKSIYISYTRR